MFITRENAKAEMSSNSRLSVLALALFVGLLGCGDERISNAPPKAENDVSPSTKSIQRDVSIITLSDSTALLDDHKFSPVDGLGKLADYLGPPDRTLTKESEETWIWDRNGIAATGTATSIDAFFIAFDPGGIRRTSPRGSFQGKVIVQGRDDLPAVTIDADSDKELVSGARKLHHGFGSSHDANSGALIDIQAGFLTAEELNKLNESPLWRSKYGDQTHAPEPAVGPDSNGKSSPPAR